MLIRTASTSVLVDAGPQWGRKAMPVSACSSLAVCLGERPSHMVLTHRDGDHVGGALSLLGSQPTAAVWASFDPPTLVSALSDPAQAQAVLARPPPVDALPVGQSWELDGVRFEVLHPSPRHLELRPAATTCRACCGSGSAPFGVADGDLEAAWRPSWRAEPTLACVPTGCWHRTTAAALHPARPCWMPCVRPMGGAGWLPQPLRPPGCPDGAGVRRAGHRLGGHARLRSRSLAQRGSQQLGFASGNERPLLAVANPQNQEETEQSLPLIQD